MVTLNTLLSPANVLDKPFPSRIQSRMMAAVYPNVAILSNNLIEASSNTTHSSRFLYKCCSL